MSTMLEGPVSQQEGNDLCFEAMRKILASQTFSKAHRLSSFLTYIVEKSLVGDLDDLTEQQIGIHVFNRAPGYNSGDDTIVRGTARHLRQRLELYYHSEGAQDALRIEIPKGAYVARFEEMPVSDVVSNVIQLPPTIVLPAMEPEARPRGRWKMWVVLALFVVVAAGWSWGRARFLASQDKSHLLWKTMFTKDRLTFLVPGDAGLNMYEVMKGKTVDLDSYTQQSYIDQTVPRGSENLADVLGQRSYAPMSDIQLVAKIIRRPEVDLDRTQVRFARDLAVRDTKDANLILMGSHSYNPWTELYQSGLSLQLSWDPKLDIFTVLNRAPQPGEPAQYQWSPKNGTRGGLTLVALTNNSQGNGRVLLIEGETMAGNYAGADFFSNGQLLDPVLAKAERPDSSLRNFEVLLQSNFIHEGVSDLHVLAVHVHDK